MVSVSRGAVNSLISFLRWCGESERPSNPVGSSERDHLSGISEVTNKLVSPVRECNQFHTTGTLPFKFNLLRSCQKMSLSRLWLKVESSTLPLTYFAIAIQFFLKSHQ